MRFSFCGIKIFCNREARILAITFGKSYVVVFSAMGKGAWIADSDKYYTYW